MESLPNLTVPIETVVPELMLSAGRMFTTTELVFTSRIRDY
jgi:hypothetical protein